MSDEAFHAFAEARLGYLRRTAYLLCGNWHTADDLTQTALTKIFLAWRRIARKDELDGYARQVLLRSYLDMRRRHSYGEVPVDRFDDVSTRPDHTDERLILMRALDQLNPQQRAVVVLRYWEDLDVASVAEALSMPPSTVRSHAARGLESLRKLLADSGLATVLEGMAS